MNRLFRFRARHFSVELLMLAAGLMFAWHMLTYIPAGDMRMAFAYWWEGVVARSGVVLVASAPMAALGGAVAGARLRSGGIQRYFGPRTRFGIAWNALWPTLMVAAIIQIFAFVYYYLYAGQPTGRPNLLIFVAYVAVIAFHMLFGFYLGLKVNWLVAVPVALLLSFQMLSQSAATEDFSLRYISGYFLYSCCAIYEVMAPWAIWPALIFNVGGTLVFLIACLIELKVASFTLRVVTLLLIPVTLTGLFFGAKGAAVDAQTFPAIQRPGIICFRSEPEVCLYPNQDAKRYVVNTVVKTWQIVHDVIPDIPKRIAFTGFAYNPPEIPLVIYPDTGKGHVIWGFLQNTLSPVGTLENPPLSCKTETMEEFEEANVSRSTLVSFLLRRILPKFPNVEMPNRDLPTGFDEILRGRLKIIDSMSPADQKKWAIAAYRANKFCKPLPKVVN